LNGSDRQTGNFNIRFVQALEPSLIHDTALAEDFVVWRQELVVFLWYCLAQIAEKFFSFLLPPLTRRFGRSEQADEFGLDHCEEELAEPILEAWNMLT
jgi:hypothetical protein